MVNNLYESITQLIQNLPEKCQHLSMDELADNLPPGSYKFVAIFRKDFETQTIEIGPLIISNLLITSRSYGNFRHREISRAVYGVRHGLKLFGGVVTLSEDGTLKPNQFYGESDDHPTSGELYEVAFGMALDASVENGIVVVDSERMLDLDLQLGDRY